jgi:hypothetical protein
MPLKHERVFRLAKVAIANAARDTSCSVIRRGREVINPPAGSLVNRYFTIEEYDADIDDSNVFADCFWKTAKFSTEPNGIITLDVSFVGTGRSRCRPGTAG